MTALIARLDSLQTEEQDLRRMLARIGTVQDSLLEMLPEEEGNRPYDLMDLDERPERIRTVPLDVSRSKGKGEAAGRVIVNFQVTTLGRVDRIQVLGASKETKERVADAVRRWLYRPGIRNGKRVAVRMTVTLDADG